MPRHSTVDLSGSSPQHPSREEQRRSNAATASGVTPIRARIESIGGGRGSDGQPNVRESFAATLWNPLHDEEKDKFNRRRLLQLFAGVLLACCGGCVYAFGIFSNKIKESARFTQAEMTTITTAGSIVGGFTFPAGILFDYAGPQYVLAVASTLGCFGFALLALIFQNVIEPTVASVAAANAISTIGLNFFDCGSLLTNLFNFPINRGDVLIIQKTFFGLGATFLSLVFSGFFAASGNYIGYAVFVCGFVAVAGTFGTIVTRLPAYKRTTRDLARIAKLDPVQQEMEREFEEKQFEMYHNPRLVDRRRLNAGVTCLLVTLAFFSTISVVETYIEIPSSGVTGLTVAACLCLFSFAIMLLPSKYLPSFFDYECLPDISPPESLVDKPAAAASPLPTASENARLIGDDGNLDANSTALDDDNRSVATTSKGHEYTINHHSNSETSSNHRGYNDDDDHRHDGRASVASNHPRASLAGNSAPIAVPEGIAPSVIPSIKTTFLQNLIKPEIWCYFITMFAMSGASTVLVSNIAQIIKSAAGDGMLDEKVNSLAVALQGIGSAVGRILVGFIETYIQRRNAIVREKQLLWAAENPDDDPSVENPDRPDMTPAYHRLSSSVLFLLPITPMIASLCTFLCTVVPYGAIPPIACFFGVGYGGFLGLVALGVREMFSVDVAKHYNFTVAATMLAAFLLNRLMFGTWFDEATKEHHAADGVSCMGYECFAKSFYVLSALCGGSVLTSNYIVYSWWKIRRTF